MDKNMIHLDDLIRQRLIGEEEERAGAWLRMKDMLDKNMPTRPAAAFNWRRMFTYSAIVAVICTAGIGGYQMTNGYRDLGGSEQTAQNTQTNNSGENTPGNNNTAAAATTTANNDQATGADNSANTVTTSGNTTNAYTAKTNATAVKNEVSASNSSAPVAQVKAPSNNNNRNNRNNNSSTNHNTQTGNTNTAPVTSIASTNTPSGNQQRTLGSGPSANEPTLAPVKEKMEMQEVATINQNNRVNVNPFTGEVAVVSTETPGKAEIPVPVKNEPAVANQPAEEEKKETIVASSVNTGNAKPTSAEPAPQAAAPGGDAGNGSSGNNSGGKKKNKGGGIDFRGFKEMLDKAEYQLGNTKVNTGIIGGINTTFGNYDMRGFNVGLFALFSFADGQSPWSVMLQARYSQYFNNRINTYSDNYTNYVTGQNGQFAQEEKEHYFKYSTASNFNVPLVLQYTPYKSKFTFFGGADMNYYFKVKAEETERTLSTTVVTTTQKSGAPLTVSDFNSRFGVGAVLGVGYNINDKMRLDLRMSKGMWDNAKGAGAQRISNDLYKTPNVQLNLGVKLGKDKKDQQ